MISSVVRAGLKHIDQLAPLFNSYRQFYRQKPDLESARQFLWDRIQHNESVIFLALENERALGFTQLYRSFSSVSMKRLWILNDLFVAENDRKQGVAEALMHSAKMLAIETRSKGIVLETEIGNAHAQKLYEKLGYRRNTETYHYFLSLEN